MSSKPVISRRLGSAENFFRSRTEIDYYRNFFAVARYNRSLTADLPLTFRALRKTVLDYHILACNVFKNFEAGHCEVLPVNKLTWGDVVEFRPDAVLPDVPEEFMAEMCERKYFDLFVHKPLFRLIFSGNHDLTVTFEHTLSDGVVARLFHEAFLEALAYCDSAANDAEYQLLYGTPPATIDMDTVLFDLTEDEARLRFSLPPPAEMCMQDPSIDYTDNDPTHFSKRKPENLTKWPGFGPATREYSLAYKLLRLSPEELKRLLAKCKEHGVTLTSYMIHAHSVAFQPLYGNHYILMTPAMTLRWFITEDKVDPEYKDIVRNKRYHMMGNFAHMGVPQILDPASEFSWDQVKEINGNMGISTKNDKVLNLMTPFLSIADDLDPNEEFFSLAISKNKSEALKLSNLGYVNFPLYEVEGKKPWTVTDVVFAQHLAPAASEFTFSIISCKEGGLTLVWSYYNHNQNLDNYADILRDVIIKNSL